MKIKKDVKMSKDFKSKFSSLRRSSSQVQANEERRRKSVSIDLVGPVHPGPYFNLTRMHKIQVCTPYLKTLDTIGNYSK